MFADIGAGIAKGAVSGIGGAIKDIATPFTNAWIESKKSGAEVAKVDKETDRDITVAAYSADVQLGLAQRLLAQADRLDRLTRPIRPAFAILSWVWLACEIAFWAAGYTPSREIAPEAKWALTGIIASFFVLRPYEKKKTSEVVTTAMNNTKKPGLLEKIGFTKKQ